MQQRNKFLEKVGFDSLIWKYIEKNLKYFKLILSSSI